MKRLIELMVCCGLVIAWRFAGSPTLRSPFPLSKNATIEGVVLRPSLLAITTGSFPSNTATQLFVVPKSIPIILLMIIVTFGSIFTNAMPIPKCDALHVKMSQLVSISTKFHFQIRQNILKSHHLRQFSC